MTKEGKPVPQIRQAIIRKEYQKVKLQ